MLNTGGAPGLTKHLPLLLLPLLPRPSPQACPVRGGNFVHVIVIGSELSVCMQLMQSATKSGQYIGFGPSSPPISLSFPRSSSPSNRRYGSSTTFARMAVQNSTAPSDGLTERTCGVPAKKAGSNETRRAEDDHSAGMAEKGTTSYPQSVDSRQSGRLHDQGHDWRKLIKFGRALNLRGSFFTD